MGATEGLVWLKLLDSRTPEASGPGLVASRLWGGQPHRISRQLPGRGQSVFRRAANRKTREPDATDGSEFMPPYPRVVDVVVIP